MVQIQQVRFSEAPLVKSLSQHSQPSLHLLTPGIDTGRLTSLSGQSSSTPLLTWMERIAIT